MRRFFRRLFRCVTDPRYRVIGPDPFPDFAQFAAAFEAHYKAFDMAVHRSVPRNHLLFELAREDFFRRHYPRLQWPDWLAAVLFFGTCDAILLAATALSHWGVIAPTVLLGLACVRIWRECQRRRKWQIDAERFFHLRRQRSLTWEYQ